MVLRRVIKSKRSSKGRAAQRGWVKRKRLHGASGMGKVAKVRRQRGKLAQMKRIKPFK